MEIITRKEAKAQGLKRYFTGKPCKWGHVAERLASSRICVECQRLQNRQYREENPEYSRQHHAKNRERIIEKKRQYYAENRDKELERNRQYREANRDRIREKNRQYHAENRERMIEHFRQYREENPEYSRQYYAENRELYRANNTKRRAAKIRRTLSHDEELTQFVMEEAAQQARDMEELFGTPFHVDHMIPMQGEEVSGLHVWYNLQVIPAHLNISKGNRMRYTKPLEWLVDAT